MNDILTKINGFLEKAQPIPKAKKKTKPKDYDPAVGGDVLPTFPEEEESFQAPQTTQPQVQPQVPPTSKKIYLAPGEKSPEGTQEYQGKRGGRFFVATGGGPQPQMTGAEQYDENKAILEEIRNDQALQYILEEYGRSEEEVAKLVGMSSNLLLQITLISRDAFANDIAGLLLERRINSGELDTHLTKKTTPEAAGDLIKFVNNRSDLSAKFCQANIDSDNPQAQDFVSKNLPAEQLPEFLDNLEPSKDSYDRGPIFEKVASRIDKSYLSDPKLFDSPVPTVRGTVMSRLDGPEDLKLIDKMALLEVQKVIDDKKVSKTVLTQSMAKASKEVILNENFLEAFFDSSHSPLGLLRRDDFSAGMFSTVYDYLDSVNATEAIGPLIREMTHSTLENMNVLAETLEKNNESLIISAINEGDETIRDFIKKNLNIDRTESIMEHLIDKDKDPEFLANHILGGNLRLKRVALERMIRMHSNNPSPLYDKYIPLILDNIDPNDVVDIIDLQNQTINSDIFDRVFGLSGMEGVNNDEVLNALTRNTRGFPSLAIRISDELDINNKDGVLGNIFTRNKSPEFAKYIKSTKNPWLREQVATQLDEKDFDESYLFDKDLAVRKIVAEKITNKDTVKSMLESIKSPEYSQNIFSENQAVTLHQLLRKARSEDKVAKFEELMPFLKFEGNHKLMGAFAINIDYPLATKMIDNLDIVPDSVHSGLAKKCSARDAKRLFELGKLKGTNNELIMHRMDSINKLGGPEVIEHFQKTGEVPFDKMDQDFLNKIKNIDGITIKCSDIHGREGDLSGLDELLHNHQCHESTRDAWLGSSSSDLSALLKEAVRKKLGGRIQFHRGVELSNWEEHLKEIENNYDLSTNDMELYVDDLYKLSQQLLEARFPGKKEFTLWRGTDMSEVAEGEAHEKDELGRVAVLLKQNPVSSWSFKKSVPEGQSFGNITLEVTVPREKIITNYLMYSFSGFEAEALLHGQYLQNAHIVPRGSQSIYKWHDITKNDTNN